MPEQNFDVIVIGAGIGGLTTAALLAHDGYRVLVLEGHIEPGGCASSYERRRPDGTRYVFDVGATLFAGFTPGGAHHWVGERLGIRWPVRRLEPAMEVWLPDARITRWGDTRWNMERQRAFSTQPRSAEAFWRVQERTANIAWRFAARLPPIPPETPGDLLGLAAAVRPEVALLAPVLPLTVAHMLKLCGSSDRRLRAFVDGQLLISAQTTADAGAWLYGAVALDFARIGAHSAEGGAWSLARTLASALMRGGGQIQYRSWVKRILIDGRRATGVETERGEYFHAPMIVVNTTLWNVSQLLGNEAGGALEQRIRRSPRGWGAFLLYLGVAEQALPAGIAEHHQVIACYDQPLGEANSIFISIHPADDLRRAPRGQRAITISTHTRVERWWAWRNESHARYREEKQAMIERVIDTASRALPSLRSHIRYQQAGTPVSFERYTHRALGQVGGLPQTLRTYGMLSLGPRAAGIAGLLMVGDSTFPGQSTAAVTQSGIRAYQIIRRHRR
jgi:C-3',4' desaturase CrtD